jgi:hypothetical protein
MKAKVDPAIKASELREWLALYPYHPERAKVMEDLRALEQELKEQETKTTK